MQTMKKAILAIAILTGLAATVNAQVSPKNDKKKNQKMEMKDEVIMLDNKAMLCKGKKCSPLTKTYTCSDGCKVAADGTVTKPDGTTMKLMNGYEIEKDGKMLMIPHGRLGHVCTKDCPMFKKM
jgi:hypothetical protein